MFEFDANLLPQIVDGSASKPVSGSVRRGSAASKQLPDPFDVLCGGLLSDQGTLSKDGTRLVLTTLMNLKSEVKRIGTSHDELLAQVTDLKTVVNENSNTILRKLNDMDNRQKTEKAIEVEKRDAMDSETKSELAALRVAIGKGAGAPIALRATDDKPDEIPNPIILNALTTCVAIGDSNLRPLRSMKQDFSAKTAVLTAPGIREAIDVVQRLRSPNGERLKLEMIAYHCFSNDISERMTNDWFDNQIDELEAASEAAAPKATSYLFAPPPRKDTPENTRRSEDFRDHLKDKPDKPKFVTVDITEQYQRIPETKLLGRDGLHLEREGFLTLAEEIERLQTLTIKNKTFRERISTINNFSKHGNAQSGQQQNRFYAGPQRGRGDFFGPNRGGDRRGDFFGPIRGGDRRPWRGGGAVFRGQRGGGGRGFGPPPQNLSFGHYAGGYQGQLW